MASGVDKTPISIPLLDPHLFVHATKSEVSRNTGQIVSKLNPPRFAEVGLNIPPLCNLERSGCPRAALCHLKISHLSPLLSVGVFLATGGDGDEVGLRPGVLFLDILPYTPEGKPSLSSLCPGDPHPEEEHDPYYYYYKSHVSPPP